MPLRLPVEAEFQPKADTLYCQMFMQTNKIRKDSKLILPDIAKEEVFVARVIRVGPGKTIEYDTEPSTPPDQRRLRIPSEVKVGDIIVFARYHGERLEIDGGYYLILREDDVLGTITVPESTIEEYLLPWTIGQRDNELAAAKVLEPA